MNSRSKARNVAPHFARRSLAVLLLAGAALASGTAAATTYRIVELPLPPGAVEFVYIYDINEAGEMVGYAELQSNNGGGAVAWGGPPDYAPRWLPKPANIESSSALSINDAGAIVGSIDSHDHLEYHAVMWGPNDVLIRLREPAETSHSGALDINNNGTIIGTHISASPATGGVYWFRPKAPHVFENFGGEDAFITLEALNDSGTFTGLIYGPGGNAGHPYRWTPVSGMERLYQPHGPDLWTRVVDVNEAGQVVGKIFSTDPDVDLDRAVIWETDGSVVDLGEPAGGAENVDPGKINNAGEVIGNYQTSLGGELQGVRWTAATGMQRIVDLIDPLDPLYPQAVSDQLEIYAINDAGVIAGVLHPDRAPMTPVVLIPQP